MAFYNLNYPCLPIIQIIFSRIKIKQSFNEAFFYETCLCAYLQLKSPNFILKVQDFTLSPFSVCPLRFEVLNIGQNLQENKEGFWFMGSMPNKTTSHFCCDKNTMTSCLRGIQNNDKDLLLKHLNALLVSSFTVIPLSAESLTLHHLVLQEAVEPRDLQLEQSHAARSRSLGQGRTCGCQTVWLFQLLTQTPYVLLSTGIVLLPLWV